MKIRHRDSGSLGTGEVILARWGISHNRGWDVAEDGVGSKRWAQPAEISLVKMFSEVYLENMGMGVVFRGETEEE